MGEEPTIVYFRDCAGITGYWLTAAEAAELFATRTCDGTLEEGFGYYGARSDGTALVGTVVTPHPIDSVPADERERLEARLALEQASTPPKMSTRADH